MPGNHPGFASSASNSGNIDLNDFPALGSQGAQVTLNASNFNLFSPHATQTPSGLSNSSMKLGMMGMLSRNAPFTHDEFPALNRTQNSVRESRTSAHGVPSAMHLMDHATPVAWQQDQPQQQRQNLAQDLARKHNLPAPQSASTLDQPAASSAWMQSYGNQSATGLNRIGMPRHGNVPSGAIRVDGSLDSDTKQHDTPGNDASEHASYVDRNEGMVQQPIDQVLYSPADRFGLVGLVSLIKTQDPDMSMLTMGNNLQSLGMNLESSDSLAASFVAPWSRDPALASMQVEPAYQLPSCYNVQPPPPAQSKVASFSDETLFLIFYSTPRDALQEVAAQELYARNWRYHKGLHLWLTKEQNTEPVQKTSTYERGTYVFFDPGSWEKVSKNFVLMYEMLEEKPSARALQPSMPSQHPTPGKTVSGGNSSRRDTSPSAHSSPQTSFA
ncbi:transcriptional regulator [Malassezia yamatoensis]|uniref:Transcriptional regulator n=1 Tax=Malassezia yamatoensis TaxID=253288 RepID=A0AAJ5YSQ5_9BASI|nr:transcriptional regulator [Malassezia yamatoensis]